MWFDDTDGPLAGWQEYFFRLTLDTIGEIAFGCDLESLR
jgi:hypothetical protein